MLQNLASWAKCIKESELQFMLPKGKASWTFIDIITKTRISKSGG
jgi:hypothetical protein